MLAINVGYLKCVASFYLWTTKLFWQQVKYSEFKLIYINIHIYIFASKRFSREIFIKRRQSNFIDFSSPPTLTHIKLVQSLLLWISKVFLLGLNLQNRRSVRVRNKERDEDFKCYFYTLLEWVCLAVYWKLILFYNCIYIQSNPFLYTSLLPLLMMMMINKFSK